jgi:hypothetical protein
MILCDIRANVDAHDEHGNLASKGESTADETSQFGHIYLGSQGVLTSVSVVKQHQQEDLAFVDFDKKLKRCIRDLLQHGAHADRLNGIEHCHGQHRPRVIIGPNDQVSSSLRCI